MFTGLVEEKGVVRQLKQLGNASDITIEAQLVSSDVSIGDSIAINGCCLTVVTIEGATMMFQAGRETLQRTNLGELKSGSAVNLERSLQVGQRMGGHYVSGHVDAVATVDQRNDDGQWAKFWFKVPDAPNAFNGLTLQMASKGSVTVDGISLTLVDVEPQRFSVELIPHTLDATTLGGRKVGDRVNIETDLLAKYVQRQLKGNA